MTDSGAYQILVYGGVDVSPEEIIRFQENIGTDVAVILDIPTGWNVKRERAEYTVGETLKRAKAIPQIRTRKDLLWVGPIQGGNHLDLVSHAASEISKIPFDIYALGSPTQVIEQYLFDIMVDMIVAAKKNLPPDKPFHLFGAGHPFMLSFAVAMGCDMFDSAAYALYARRGKYMIDYGTIGLKDLSYFPCACKLCSNHTPKEVLKMSANNREYFLAWHNLHQCFTEIRRIKQAMISGRLWELLELRAKGHPFLLQALKRVGEYSEYLESGTPISKQKGLLYFSSSGLQRPEILRYRKKSIRWFPSTQADVLILLSKPASKPFHRSREYRKTLTLMEKRFGSDMNKLQFCTYTAPFGLIPVELDEIYPLSQFEMTNSPNVETANFVAEQVEEFLKYKRYRLIALQFCPLFGEKVERVCKKVVGLETLLVSGKNEKLWTKNSITNFVESTYKAFKELYYPSLNGI